MQESTGTWCSQRAAKSSLIFYRGKWMKPYLKTLCVWQYSFVKNTLLCLRLTLLHQFYEFLLRSMAYYFIKIILFLSFPGDSDGRESACNAGGLGSIPGSGRSPGEGNANSLQYSCLEDSMDRGAWQATGLKGLY